MSSEGSRSSIRLFYPLFLDITGRLCIVVGGGRVAERKVMTLIGFGGRVRVISPETTKKITGLQVDGRIEVLKRPYRRGDLKGAALVFAATGDRETNRRVTEEASEEAIPVNVVDDPELCSFIVPSIIKKKPIVIAVSTLGQSPALSRRLADEIRGHITGDHVLYARIMGRFRKHLIERVRDRRKRKAIMDAIKNRDIKEVNRLGVKGLIKRFLGGNRG